MIAPFTGSRNKTQGLWLSPLLSRKSDTSTSVVPFEEDLVEYLYNYGNVTKSLVVKLKQFDFTSCHARVVASVPGRFTHNKHKWGHLKLRAVVGENYKPENISSTTTTQLVVQISSIGSLGTSADNWLTREFLQSLSASKNSATIRPARTNLSLIYPSVENVQNSFEGYAAGGSLPFDEKNYQKQKQYMLPLLHSWQSNQHGRTKAMPHIKTFARINNDDHESHLEWILLTSSNLSKAAWGAYEKNQSQLMIRSYEFGVIFIGDHLTELMQQRERVLEPNAKRLKPSGCNLFQLLPYDFPLQPYRPDEECWTSNKPRASPDLFGETWLC